ncbi:MAG: hypothetical protein Q4A40_06530 [Bacillota bacterium]|nr:hypothetical protein [Bacillota bacterium]
MMKTKKWFAVLACAVMAFSCLIITGCGSSGETEAPAEEPAAATWAESDIPGEVQAKVDEVKEIAGQIGKELEGEFGDNYKALIESGEGEEYEGFAALREQLDSARTESGATYVYAMSPSDGKGMPSLDGDTGEKGAFLIGVDGSEDPDPWGEDYGWEIQFTEAWNGDVAAARSAWADTDDMGAELCWSAFAPIIDSDGNVVGIVGVDYPANEILDFPEWNRDSDSWNGITE